MPEVETAPCVRGLVVKTVDLLLSLGPEGPEILLILKVLMVRFVKIITFYTLTCGYVSLQ